MRLIGNGHENDACRDHVMLRIGIMCATVCLVRSENAGRDHGFQRRAVKDWDALQLNRTGHFSTIPR